MIRGPQVYEHVMPHDAPVDLPVAARDVCFTTRPPMFPSRFIEFELDEDSCREWAAGLGCEMHEIDHREIMMTYRQYLPSHRAEGSHTIHDGIYGAKWDEVDRDRGFIVAYDRQTGRAYYASHLR